MTDRWLSEALRPQSVPGPLAAVFARIAKIPGYFNYSDATHFCQTLEMQALHDVKGDMLEIGTYAGKSAALLSFYVNPGETLHLCDAFELETSDHYSATPSRLLLEENLLAVNPEFSFEQVVVHECYSTELSFEPGTRFRFIHVDGAHDAETCRRDLELAANHLHEFGVIAVDDYKHASWPGVTEGVDQFLADNPEVQILSDLNRREAVGRKLYLSRRSTLARRTRVHTATA